MNKKPYAQIEKTIPLLKRLQSPYCSQQEAMNILSNSDILTVNTAILVMLIGNEYLRMNHKKPIKHYNAVLYDWSKHYGITPEINKDYELDYFFSKPYKECIERALKVFGFNGKGGETIAVY